MSTLEQLLPRLAKLLDRLEGVPPEPVSWKSVRAAKWLSGSKNFRPIPHPYAMPFEALHGIDEQKQQVDANTRQFVAGKPANNVLLTGARGCGKSSLVRAMLTCYGKKGLRMIEVDKRGLMDFPEILAQLEGLPEKFVLYCDDLSFGESETGYAELKAALDGSLAGPLDNVLIYATSNRRHLLPEYYAENEATVHEGNEIHAAEAVEEKISLSDRFGLWVSFYAMEQDVYLAVAREWAQRLAAKDTDSERFTRAALQWSLARSARSGRVAYQFAKDWAGQGR
ncbi:MAG: ATP-binding protein [Thiobacillus sp.]